jgi:short-subunit dehydrogenase
MSLRTEPRRRSDAAAEVPALEAALVIGASSGIGAAVARRLAASGLDLVVTARDPAALEPVVEDCRQAGASVSAVALDIRDADEVTRVVDDLVERCGPGVAVVHSAAVMSYGVFEEVPNEVLARVVETNVLGTATVAQAALRAFRRVGSGHLVVIGSLLGEIAAPYVGSYVLSKWAVHGLVRTLQLETRHHQGIEVSLVAPGAIDTPIYETAATTLGRHGSPPPPVRSPEAVADRVVSALRRPRRITHVGPANRVIISGFRFMPALYDALALPMMRTFGLGPWQDLEATAGNVFAPSHDPTERPHQEVSMLDRTSLNRPRVSRSVAAPAEAVWEVLSDGWLYASWVVGASRVRDVDGDWPAAGTRLHHSVGLWPALLSDSTEVEVSEPPYHLVLTPHGKALGSARVDITIVPDGAQSCTVTIAEDAVSGLGKLIPMPARQVMVLPRNQEALRRLALLAEGRHRQGSGPTQD